MQQTLETMVATRRWVAQMLGAWTIDEVFVHKAPKHILPSEVLEKVLERWEAEMRRVGSTEIGSEGVHWRIVPAEPYSRMEVNVGGEWRLRMFAGPQTRIEFYIKVGDKLVLIHSPTNYAESLATNNFKPWELVKEYGERNALADGHAVSIAITVMDGNTELMQFFRRGKGLGEYGGYIGTAAGSSLTQEITPYQIDWKDGAEESRLVPFLIAHGIAFKESGIMPAAAAIRGYEHLGIAKSEFDVVEHVPGGMKVSFLDRRGNKAQGILLSPIAPFIMTGLALNVDPDDHDTTGKNKPHHKSEYLFLLRTGLPREAADDTNFGWTRNDEHAEAFYVPIGELQEYVIENFLGMMPPTSAVTLATIRHLNGHEAFERTRHAINTKYPMGNDHPLLAVVRDRRYNIPELIVK